MAQESLELRRGHAGGGGFCPKGLAELVGGEAWRPRLDRSVEHLPEGPPDQPLTLRTQMKSQPTFSSAQRTTASTLASASR